MQRKTLINQPESQGTLLSIDVKIKEEAQYTKKLIEQQLAYGTKRVYQSDWKFLKTGANLGNINLQLLLLK